MRHERRLGGVTQRSPFLLEKRIIGSAVMFFSEVVVLFGIRFKGPTQKHETVAKLCTTVVLYGSFLGQFVQINKRHLPPQAIRY